jgi:putative membrane protein
MMGNWVGWGGFGIGWLVMILFWGAVIFLLVGAVRWLCSTELHGSGFGPNAALHTLRQRYARGEIGRDEYEQMRRDLSD